MGRTLHSIDNHAHFGLNRSDPATHQGSHRPGQVRNLSYGSTAVRRGDHFGGEAGNVFQSIIGGHFVFADRGDVPHDR